MVKKPSRGAKLSLGVALVAQVGGFGLLAYLWARDWSHGEEGIWLLAVMHLSVIAIVAVLASALAVILWTRWNIGLIVLLISSFALTFLLARVWLGIFGG